MAAASCIALRAAAARLRATLTKDARMKKAWRIALVLAMLVALPALAAGPGGVRKKVEASMQVTGQVVIAPGGELQSYTLDRPELLPEAVKSLLAKYLPACEFSVVTASGKPETVISNMSLQVLARQNSEGGSTLSVNASRFADPDAPETIKARDMAPPNYPMDAGRMGFSGTVYVVLRLNPDGTVAQAHAEQVNMTVVASDNALRIGRRLLEKAALVKARDWRFEIMPARLAETGPVDVRVPVDFSLRPERPGSESKYGQWQGYVPGPYAAIPWRPQEAEAEGLGALAAGGLYPLESRIKLKNPPAGT